MDTQLKVTLPEDLAEQVRAWVSSGEFADESEVVREALEDFVGRERSYQERLEHWLRTEVVASYEAWKANPSDVYGVEEVKAYLQRRREARRKG